MSRYLVIGFRNAKLFRDKRATKDKVFDCNGVVEDKSGQPWWKEPITLHQVSNLLHVLFGERPVPSARRPFLAYSRQEDLFLLASKCSLRIDSAKVLDNKNGPQFIMETTRIKKAMHNAWSKNALPTSWQRIREYTEEHFDAFVEKVEAALGKGQLKRKFSDVHQDLAAKLAASIEDYPKGKDYSKAWGMLASKDRSDAIVDLLLFLKENQMAALASYIIDREAQGGQMNMTKNKTAVTVVNGVDKAAFLSGSILVPIDDAMIERVRSFAGSMTILDGGMAWIEGVRDGSDIDSDGYAEVGSISLETY